MFDDDKFTVRFQALEELRNGLFSPQNKVGQKIRVKRERFLLQIPLFSLIYQKKGGENFKIIVENIKIVKMGFGQIVFNSNNNRTFNHILDGTVMLFVKPKSDDPINEPKFYRKYRTGDHFGQKMIFGKQEVQSARCVSVHCYLLQLDKQNFYKSFSGHFQYQQLNNQVDMLQSIWVFNKMKKSHLERMLLSSQKCNYIRGHILFKNEDTAPYLLVIMEGQVTLLSMKEGKLKPFSICSKLQVCGMDQIVGNKPYDCVGMCTADHTQILMVDPTIVLQIFQRDIPPEVIDSRQKLSSQLRQSSYNSKRLHKSVMSINLVTKRYNESKSKKLRTEPSSSVQITTKHEKLDPMKLLNDLFVPRIQLKYPKTRTIRQDHIKTKQRQTIYSSKRISSYVNKQCTYDKQIIVSYLQRKQKIYQTAMNRQLDYQKRKVMMVPELIVQRSSAVKQHKRKLKNSRRQHYSSLHQL